jgi:two-component system chemotaxis response regulator CheY
MSSYSILLVDDAMFMRMAVAQMLAGTEFRVVAEAANGREAVECYRSLWPDLVLMDVVMPEMGGAEALAALRELDPQARVIMASSLGEADRQQDLLAAGAQDYLIKPYEPERLLTALRAAVGH